MTTITIALSRDYSGLREALERIPSLTATGAIRVSRVYAGRFRREERRARPQWTAAHRRATRRRAIQRARKLAKRMATIRRFEREVARSQWRQRDGV